MKRGLWGWGQGSGFAALGLWLAACGDSGATTQGATGTTEASTSSGPSTETTSKPTTSATGGESSSGGASQGMTDATTSPTTGSPTGDPSGTTATSDATTTQTATGTTEPGTSTAVSASTGDATSGTTAQASMSDTGTSTSTTTGDTGTSSEGTTGAVMCEPGDGMGMGMVEKSFIWIASQNSNDISKVNTQTMVELARYRTGPTNNESPSRTAVSADGRFVVVNDRQTGRSTMIAANVEDCIDKNGNNMIETSQSKNDLRAWGQDECVMWSLTWPYKGAWQHGPRGVTWTLGHWDYDLCEYVEPKVWIGYMSNDLGGTTVHLVRVDGISGSVEETIKVPNWVGSDFAPYGAALDPQFRPWFSSLRGEFVRVNTDQNPITVTRFTPPAAVQSYGFTVDQDGNPWFAGWTGPVTMYDVDSDTYIQVPGTSGIRRGIAADENYVWAAANNNPSCGLLQIDRKTHTLIQFHTTNPCNTAIGLSIDAEKFVWLVDQGGWAWKFDPDNVPGMMKVDIAGSHYVYSDMTGGQLLSISPQ